jgi:outer membrane protein
MTLRLPLRLALRPARVATAVVALILAAAAPKLYAQARFGVVDVQRAISETNEGRAAMGAIKARFDDRQTELNNLTKQLEGLKKQLDRPQSVVNRARLQKTAQQKLLQLQQLGQQYTEELQRMEAEAMQNILTKMQPIVREIGQSRSLEIVVDQRVVHFARSDLNLTDLVIAQYNQRYPAPAASPAGTAPAGGRGEADAGAGAAVSSTGRGAGTVEVPPPPMAQGDAGAPRRGGLPGVFFRDGGR